MAHSLLNYILNDNNFEPLNIKPQQIVLGSLRNPILRALFSTNVQPEAFIASHGDGCRIYLFRLSAEAKPEQLNYAAITIQTWFSDVSFEVARDASYMDCDVPEATMIRRLTDRLSELDAISRKLKSKTGIVLQKGKLDTFNSIDLVKEFLGDCFKTYNIPVIETDEAIVAG